MANEPLPAPQQECGVCAWMEQKCPQHAVAPEPEPQEDEQPE